MLLSYYNQYPQNTVLLDLLVNASMAAGVGVYIIDYTNFILH